MEKGAQFEIQRWGGARGLPVSILSIVNSRRLMCLVNVILFATRTGTEVFLQAPSKLRGLLLV